MLKRWLGELRELGVLRTRRKTHRQCISRCFRHCSGTRGSWDQSSCNVCPSVCPSVSLYVRLYLCTSVCVRASFVWVTALQTRTTFQKKWRKCRTSEINRSRKPLVWCNVVFPMAFEFTTETSAQRPPVTLTAMALTCANGVALGLFARACE